MLVERTDFVGLPKLARSKIDEDGFWRGEGRVARAGVQVYRNADGTERRELRLPEEVAKSVAQFGQTPLTLDHPSGRVNAMNARAVVVGSVGAARFDGAWVAAPIAIFDAEAIAAARTGRSQLSVGYSAEVEDVDQPDPALVARFGKYDCLQRGIRINHVALVDRARAGSDARLRLDSEAIITDDETTEEGENMGSEEKNDGAEIETLRAERDRLAGELAAMKSSRADGDAQWRDDFDTQVSNRLGLFKVCWEAGMRIEPKNYAGKSNAEIKRALLRLYNPRVDVKGKSAEYVDGVFDVLVREQAFRHGRREGAEPDRLDFDEQDAEDRDPFAPSSSPELARRKQQARRVITEREKRGDGGNEGRATTDELSDADPNAAYLRQRQRRTEAEQAKLRSDLIEQERANHPKWSTRGGKK